jgi:hypothetical protein
MRRADLLCLEDLAITSGIRHDGGRRYEARARTGEAGDPVVAPIESQGEGRVCVTLPRAPDASASRPAYLVVEIVASTRGRETTGPLRVHAYDTGAAMRVVAIERPASPALR